MTAKQKIVGLLFLAAVFAPAEPGYARKCKSNTDRCNDAEATQTIPVKIYRNFLVVAEGQIGGLPERQNFILDTGTAPSIIAAKQARQLGLATIPSTFTAVGRIVPMQTAVIPEIDLGPIRALSLVVQVQDLSRLERVLGLPIAGIIGLDVLTKSSFYLDYDKRELEFGEIARDGIPVPFDPRSGLAIAQVTLGERVLHILVDTGSDRVVVFAGNFPEAEHLALRNTTQTGTSLADREMAVRQFSAPTILIGGEHFSEDTAYLVPESADPVFDGLLGVRALGFRALSYDHASAMIYLQK